MLFDKKYDLIFSIGQACSCTKMLRKFKLQFYSYPCDWIFGSTIIDRVKILTNEYKDFLNFEDIQVTSDSNNIATNLCAACINTRTQIRFTHDFPYGQPAEETYPKIKEKYDRRIKRQLNQIEKSERVLVVYLQMPNNDEYIDDEILIEAHSMLEKRFSKQEITFLYISCEHGKKDYELKEVSKNVIRTSFDYDAYLSEAPNMVSEINMEKLFCKIKISRKFLTPKNYWRRFFYLLKCFYKGKL